MSTREIRARDLCTGDVLRLSDESSAAVSAIQYTIDDCLEVWFGEPPVGPPDYRIAASESVLVR